MKKPEEALYKKLESHFNNAAAKYPRWASVFEEQLLYYKNFLAGTAPKNIPDSIMDVSPASARPPEMIEVLRDAYKIYKSGKSQKP